MMPVNISLFAIHSEAGFADPEAVQDWVFSMGKRLDRLTACCAFAWPLEMPP